MNHDRQSQQKYILPPFTVYGFLLKNLLKFTGCVLPWFCIFVWINFATTNKPQKRQSGVYFILKKSNERNCYGEVAHVQFVVACHLLFKNNNFLFDQPFTFLIRKYNIASSGNTYVSNKRLYRNMLPPFYFWKILNKPWQKFKFQGSPWWLT